MGKISVLALFFILLCFAACARADIIKSYSIFPGSPSETDVLLKSIDSSVQNNTRTAPQGGMWIWRFIVPPASRLQLSFQSVGIPKVDVWAWNGKPIHSVTSPNANGYIVYATAPPNQPVGAGVRFRFRALTGDVQVQNIMLTVRMPDTNRDGIGNFVERLMGLAPNQRPRIPSRNGRPHTTLYTSSPYSPEIAFPVDQVLIPPASTDIQGGWTENGYPTAFTSEQDFTPLPPMRSGGVRMFRPFESAWLDFSLLSTSSLNPALVNLPAYPVAPPPNQLPEQSMSDWKDRCVAAFMQCNLNNVEIIHDPSKTVPSLTPDWIGSLNLLCGDIGGIWQHPYKMDAGSDGIFAVSDPSAQGRLGLSYTLPLLLQGVPIQAIPPASLASPSTYAGMRTLLLPADALTNLQTGYVIPLTNWVRSGGDLIVFGGKSASDLNALWTGLSIGTPESQNVAPAPPTNAPSILLAESKENSPQQKISIDVSKWISPNGSLTLRFNCEPNDNSDGFHLFSLEMMLNGKLGLSFRAGSELESRFLSEDSGSLFIGQNRTAIPTATTKPFWTYHFEGLVGVSSVIVELNIGGRYQIYAQPAESMTDRLDAMDSRFGPLLAHIICRLDEGYSLLNPPPGATALYALRGYNPPAIWMAQEGKGSLYYCAFNPDFITLNEQRSRLLEALVKSAYESQPGEFSEASAMIVRRGNWTLVHTFDQDINLDGDYVDLFSPTLNILQDPDIPAESSDFLKRFDPSIRAPRILAVTGKILAKYESFDKTSFYVSGSLSSNGEARIWNGDRRLNGIKAYTLMGAPVPVQFIKDDRSILVKYPNYPDGVVVKIGWCP